MKTRTALTAFFVVFLLAACSRSENKSETSTSPSDNRSATAPATTAPGTTASDQPENEADRKIVQEIRQAVTNDDSLSTSAKNVTIVSQNGNVTLRGNVKDSTEKEKVAAKAQQVAGVAKVDNQLTVTQ